MSDFINTNRAALGASRFLGYSLPPQSLFRLVSDSPFFASADDSIALALAANMNAGLAFLFGTDPDHAAARSFHSRMLPGLNSMLSVKLPR